MDQISYYKNREQLQVIISEILKLTQNTDNLVLVAVAGIPGIGKTTFCEEVILSRFPEAIIIPMDGYHIFQKNLDKEGIKRRGAPFTFQKERFLNDLKNLKSNQEGLFPSFQHNIKDPVENTIMIDKTVKLVIVEGLYLFLQDWHLLDLFDCKIYIRGDLESAIQKLAQRHLDAGIVDSLADGLIRAQGSDHCNALEVIEKSDLEGVYFVDV